MLKIRAPDLTAQLWCDTEQGKEIRGDLITLHALGHALAGQVCIPTMNGGEVIECLVLLIPVTEVCGRRFNAIRILLGDRFPDGCNAIEVGECEGPEEKGIHVAEYRSVRTDPQRQSGHGQRSNAGT